MSRALFSGGAVESLICRKIRKPLGEGGIWHVSAVCTIYGFGELRDKLMQSRLVFRLIFRVLGGKIGLLAARRGEEHIRHESVQTVA